MNRFLCLRRGYVIMGLKREALLILYVSCAKVLGSCYKYISCFIIYCYWQYLS